MEKLRCCICGKIIEDYTHDSNNPDPLKDENGKFLADSDGRCCKECDENYVIPFRIAAHYGSTKTCEILQKQVIDKRKSWRK